MSYVLAFLGFAALIILHEAGHFVAAKAVGMRVERFALFFPPLIYKRKRGETEYGIGLIPLGGYVKITGMNPNEVIPKELEDRAYYRQPPWKRIVVIAAGPAVNLVLAFVLAVGVFGIAGQGTDTVNQSIASLQHGAPAAGVLHAGDRIVSVDGKGGGPLAIQQRISSHRCAGAQVQGCRAATPVHFVVSRAGHLLSFSIFPVYDTTTQPARTRVGFSFGDRIIYHQISTKHALDLGTGLLWTETTDTASTLSKIFQPKERRQLQGVVGIYVATQEAFSFDTATAIELLAIISWILALMNLLPFLPLDGGHIFWAVVEKLRGRAVPVAVMERASVVGIMLIVVVGYIGLSNSIHQIANGGFGIH
jgi:regulator of sigma E protease